MNIILFGPPGAGKGTQAHLIQDRHGLDVIATGEILRAEIAKKTSLGVQVEQIMAEGKFPSDDIILSLFKERLTKAAGKGLVLDGLPRTLNQAEKIAQAFEEAGCEINVVIQLAVDEEELIKRLSSRVVCVTCGTPHTANSSSFEGETCYKCGSNHLARRPDDEPEAIRNRFKIYNEKTKPLLDYYSKQGLLKVIDGMQSVEEVNKEIETLLGQTQVLTRKPGCLYSAQDI
ncbi:MAG: adenylate kinase [Caedimonadaceae bacterium]|nr:MAG: adenylate kinase [Caedimonadaceae bacterium]